MRRMVALALSFIATVATPIGVIALGSPASATQTCLRSKSSKCAADARPVLIAFDAETGHVQWKLPKADRGGNFAVVAANSKTVVGLRQTCGSWDHKYRPGDSVLVALDASTGKERWRLPDIGPTTMRYSQGEPLLASSGVVDGTYLAEYPAGVIPVFSAEQHTLRGLDSATGETRWQVKVGDTRPVGGNAQFVVLATESREPTGQLVAFDRATGRRRWTLTLDDPNLVVAFDANKSRGVILTGLGPPGAQDRMHLIDMATGTQLVAMDVDIRTTPTAAAITDRAAIVSSWQGSHAFDPTTGAPLWSTDGSVSGPNAVADGLAFTAFPPQPGAPSTATSRIDALDTASGVAAWTTSALNGPVVSVVRARNGTVAIVDQQNTIDGSALTENIAVRDTLNGTVRWSRAPSDIKAVRSNGPVFETFLSLGERSLYLYGGCALTFDQT